MEDLMNLSLAKMVILNPGAATVLEKHHLDFCCKGKQTLKEAVANNDELLAKVNKELEEIFDKTDSVKGIMFEEYSLTKLIDYIIDKHHGYVKEICPLLYNHTQKIALKHGERHPELARIAEIFVEIKHDFEQHMMKEEGILFPRIKLIEAVYAGLNHDHVALSVFGPIQMMMAEHEIAGKAMEEIRLLSNDFTPPSDACTTYKVAFMELQQFELDLHQHVHLENNILFPKASEMFNKIASEISRLN